MVKLKPGMTFPSKILDAVKVSEPFSKEDRKSVRERTNEMKREMRKERETARETERESGKVPKKIPDCRQMEKTVGGRKGKSYIKVL